MRVRTNTLLRGCHVHPLRMGSLLQLQGPLHVTSTHHVFKLHAAQPASKDKQKNSAVVYRC